MPGPGVNHVKGSLVALLLWWLPDYILSAQAPGTAWSIPGVGQLLSPSTLQFIGA